MLADSREAYLDLGAGRGGTALLLSVEVLREKTADEVPVETTWRTGLRCLDHACHLQADIWMDE